MGAIDVNMKNFACWFDGVYDITVSFDAASSKIADNEASVIYFGPAQDKVRASMKNLFRTPIIQTTNGLWTMKIYGVEFGLEWRYPKDPTVFSRR